MAYQQVLISNKTDKIRRERPTITRVIRAEITKLGTPINA